jgi:hypothetical protein
LEVTPGTIFQDKPEIILGFIPIVEFDDVRVIQSVHDLNLIDNLRRMLRQLEDKEELTDIVHHIFIDPFNGNIFDFLFFSSLVNLRIISFSNLFINMITIH